MKRGIFRGPHMELWDTPPSHLEGNTSGIGKTRGKQDRPSSNMGVYVKVKGRRSGDSGRGAGAWKGQPAVWAESSSTLSIAAFTSMTNLSIRSHCGWLQARQTAQRMTSALDLSAGRMGYFFQIQDLNEILLFWDLPSVAVTVQRIWWSKYAAATDDLSRVSFIKLHNRGTGSIFTACQLNDTWSFYANSFPLLVLCNFSLRGESVA